MAIEPITRQEQIIAGKDLKPITRMEMFLKQYGGSSGTDEVAGFEFVRFSFGEDDAFICDKTYQELAEKVSKKVLVGILDEGENSALTPAFVDSRDSDSITFKFIGYNSYLIVKADGSAEYFET